MNPLDEAAKESSAHTGPISSARDDYALASPLQVVVDTQDGTLPLSVLVAAMPATRCDLAGCGLKSAKQPES